jgi:hypothetical protein
MLLRKDLAMPAEIAALEREALTPLPGGLVERVRTLVHEKEVDGTLYRWLATLENVDRRHHAGYISTSLAGGRVRKLEVSGEYRGADVVLKRTHSLRPGERFDAASTIADIRSRAEQWRCLSPYEFVDVAAYAVGTEVILMPNVHAPTVADILTPRYEVSESGAALISYVNERGLLQPLQAIAQDLRPQGFKTDNVWLFDARASSEEFPKGMFVFGLHLDVY